MALALLTAAAAEAADLPAVPSGMRKVAYMPNEVHYSKIHVRGVTIFVSPNGHVDISYTARSDSFVSGDILHVGVDLLDENGIPVASSFGFKVPKEGDLVKTDITLQDNYQYERGTFPPDAFGRLATVRLRFND
jgi:hypothetical protein